MKVIIAGGRDINLSKDEIQKIVDESGFEVTHLIEGDANGIDNSGKNWAINTNTDLTTIKADWNKHGRAAGPIRNREMAEMGGALILIWDGKSKGSASMLREAKRADLLIHEEVIDVPN